MSISPIVGAILAAGEASRMGHPKQLLVHQGLTLLERLIREVRVTSVAPIAVILGAHQEVIKPHVTGLSIQVRVNPDWREGMSSSLRTAVDWAAGLETEPAGLLLLAVDQPLIDRASIERLVREFDGTDRIVAACYDDTLGIPTLFGRDFFPELLRLSGDRGAKSLLKKFSDQVVAVDMPEARLDLDRIPDWEAFLEGRK